MLEEKMGYFVATDGLDGAGKSVVIDALCGWAKSDGLKIFDLVDYQHAHHALPEVEDFKDYDVILSAEPTFSWIGAAIRDEIIRDNKREYSALTTATAFSINREILHKRVIIPARKLGKYIFQERSVSTSIIYQPIQGEGLPLKVVRNLYGNKFALENGPDLLIIPLLDAKTAMIRSSSRQKQDEAIFENLAFQREVDVRYRSDWFRRLFEMHGTEVAYIDASGTEEQTRQRTLKVWEDFLKNQKNI